MTTGMRGRGAMRGSRGGNGRGQFGGRGRGLKPPPLMSRPMPPPYEMRRPMMHPHPSGVPPLIEPWGVEPGFGPPARGRGMPPRGGPRGQNMRPPFGRMPRGGRRGGLLPPPMPGPGGPGMFRPGPPRIMGGPRGMMRGRGMPMRGRGLPMRGNGLPMRGNGLPMRGRGGPLRGRGMPARGRGHQSSSRGSKSSKAAKGKTQKGKIPKVPTSPSWEMNKPWVTEAMKNEILKKHKLHQKAKKAKTKEDWEVFKEHRNKVTTMLREAKLEYIGAHPDEDVDKILAEAGNSVSEINIEGIDPTPPNLEEPMEEGANTGEATSPQDPEVEMVPPLSEEPSAQTETNLIDN